MLTGVALIAAFRRALGTAFALWRQPPYEYEHDKLPIEILSGSAALTAQIESETAATTIAATWQAEEAAFRKACARVPALPIHDS